MTFIEKKLFEALRDIVYDDMSDMRKSLLEKAKEALAMYRREQDEQELDGQRNY